MYNVPYIMTIYPPMVPTTILSRDCFVNNRIISSFICVSVTLVNMSTNRNLVIFGELGGFVKEVPFFVENRDRC